MILKKAILLLAVPFIIGVADKDSVSFDNKFLNKIPSMIGSNSRYKSLEEKELPIVGFSFIPSEYNCGSNNPDFMNRTNVGNYKAAGFNLVSAINEMQNINTKQLRRAMDMCAEFDLGYIVRDPTIYGTRAYEPYEEEAPSVEYYEDHVKSLWVTDHPAFAGFGFIDEPTYYNYSRIANAHQAINNLLPDTLNLTTLFPVYGRSYFGLGIDNVVKPREEMDKWECYEIYVDEYIRQCNPKVLIDEYYMFYREEDSELTPKKSEDFFRSLSFYREKAKSIGVPFWGMASSGKHGVKKPHYSKEIKWAINMCLAYGAQGLQYYTYWPVVEMADVFNMEKANYFALTSPNGVPNDQYYLVKEINNFAHSMEDVIMNAEHVGMVQYGNNKISVIPEKDNLKIYGSLQNIKCNSAVVGCFNNAGKPAYLVVSDSITSGYELFDFSFGERVDLRVRTLRGVETYKDVRSFSEFLSGGEACMVEVL